MLRVSSRVFQRIAVVAIAVVALGLFGPAKSVASATPGSVAGSSGGSALVRASECVASTQELDVLLLVDASGSLKRSDPTHQRVAAVRSVLESLAGLAEHPVDGRIPKVNVALSVFGVGFDPIFDWEPLNYERVDELQERATALEVRNGEWDTDYFAAMSGAEQLFSKRTASCRALLWFTDGDYDIEPRGARGLAAKLGTTKPYDPSIDITSVAGTDALEQRGRQLLCEPGGLVDKVRSANISVITIALVNPTTGISPDGEQFLRSMATGGEGNQTCGRPTETENGYFVPVKDLSSLVEAFDVIANTIALGTQVPGGVDLEACGSEASCDITRSLRVPVGVTRVHTIVRTGGAGRTVTLGIPGLEPLTPELGTSATSSTNGVSIRHAWLGADIVTFDVSLPLLEASAEPATNPLATPWTMTVSSPGGSAPGEDGGYRLFLYSSLRVALDPEARLAEQGNGRLRFLVTGPDGAPLPAGYLDQLGGVSGEVQWTGVADRLSLGQFADTAIDTRFQVPSQLVGSRPATGKVRMTITTAGEQPVVLRPSLAPFSIQRCNLDCGVWGDPPQKKLPLIPILGGVTATIALVGAMVFVRRRRHQNTDSVVTALHAPHEVRCYAARVRVYLDHVVFLVADSEVPFSLHAGAFADSLTTDRTASGVTVAGISIRNTSLGPVASKVGASVVTSEGGEARWSASAGTTAPLTQLLAPSWMFAFDPSMGTRRDPVQLAAPTSASSQTVRVSGLPGVVGGLERGSIEGDLVVLIRDPLQIPNVVRAVQVELPSTLAPVLT
jgi:hypothetical protein